MEGHFTGEQPDIVPAFYDAKIAALTHLRHIALGQSPNQVTSFEQSVIERIVVIKNAVDEIDKGTNKKVGAQWRQYLSKAKIRDDEPAKMGEQLAETIGAATNIPLDMIDMIVVADEIENLYLKYAHQHFSEDNQVGHEGGNRFLSAGYATINKLVETMAQQSPQLLAADEINITEAHQRMYGREPGFLTPFVEHGIGSYLQTTEVLCSSDFKNVKLTSKERQEISFLRHDLAKQLAKRAQHGVSQLAFKGKNLGLSGWDVLTANPEEFIFANTRRYVGDAKPIINFLIVKSADVHDLNFRKTFEETGYITREELQTRFQLYSDGTIEHGFMTLPYMGARLDALAKPIGLRDTIECLKVILTSVAFDSLASADLVESEEVGGSTVERVRKAILKQTATPKELPWARMGRDLLLPRVKAARPKPNQAETTDDWNVQAQPDEGEVTNISQPPMPGLHYVRAYARHPPEGASPRATNRQNYLDDLEEGMPPLPPADHAAVLAGEKIYMPPVMRGDAERGEVVGRWARLLGDSATVKAMKRLKKDDPEQ